MYGISFTMDFEKTLKNPFDLYPILRKMVYPGFMSLRLTPGKKAYFHLFFSTSFFGQPRVKLKFTDDYCVYCESAKKMKAFGQIFNFW
jgi:hypothetical protein